MALDDQFNALANLAAGETAVPSPTEPEGETRSLGDLIDDAGFNNEEYTNLEESNFEKDEEPEVEGFPEPEDNYNPEDQTDAVVQANAAEKTPSVPEPKPVPNPLHSYATYTYRSE